MQPLPHRRLGRTRASTPPASATAPISARHCATDFAGNRRCTSVHTVLIDNNPPAHPKRGRARRRRGLASRRTTSTSTGRTPTRGRRARSPAPPGASSVAPATTAASSFAAGRDRRSLDNLAVPAAGAYSLQLWLRDEAGNEAPSTAVTVPLRLRRRRPALAFATEQPEGQVEAEVADAHSGPASGQILYRRIDAGALDRAADEARAGWRGQGRSARTAAGPRHRQLRLPGRCRRRGRQHDVDDAAGRRHADGDPAGAAAPHPAAPRIAGEVAALRAAPRRPRPRRLAHRALRGAGADQRPPHPRADGAGIGDRELRVASHPSRGALASAAPATVRTGEQGGFELRLPAGPSRRITVSFAGDAGLEPALRAGLQMRVRSGVSLRVAPPSLRTGQAVRLWRQSDEPGGADPAAGQAGRDPVLRAGEPPLAAGARHPQRPPRPLPRPLPLPLRQRRGRRSASAPLHWPRSAGPTRPDPRRR